MNSHAYIACTFLLAITGAGTHTLQRYGDEYVTGRTELSLPNSILGRRRREPLCIKLGEQEITSQTVFKSASKDVIPTSLFITFSVGFELPIETRETTIPETCTDFHVEP